MNFVKSLLGFSEKRPNQDQSDFEDFEKYNGKGILFIIQNETKQCLFESCKISFIQNEEAEYNYLIYVQNLQNNQSQNNEYYFPVEKDMNLKQYNFEDNEILIYGFEWIIDSSSQNKIALEFTGTDEEDLVDGFVFGDLICKLIYQTINKQQFSKEKNVENIYKYCQAKNDQKNEENQDDINKNNIDQLRNKFEQQLNLEESKTDENQLESESQALTQIIQKDSIKCAYSGIYGYIQDKYFETCLDYSIFVLNQTGQFEYQLQIFNIYNKCVYEKEILGEFSYDIFIEKNMICWLNCDKMGEISSQAFIFRQPDISTYMKLQIPQILIEINHQQKLEEIIKNQKEDSGYVTRFISQEEDQFDEEILNSFQQYKELDYDQQYITKTQENLFNKTMVQLKKFDRQFVSKQGIISAYQPDDDNYLLKFICDLPPVKSLSNTQLEPKKMMISDQNQKLLFLDDQNNKIIYYMDIEKGRVVNEYSPDEVNTIQDISNNSKHGDISDDKLFLGINQRNIFRLDPRVDPKHASVQQKTYTKSNKFNCISTNQSGNFAIGSLDGSIRLFQDVGKNSKNLYPGWGDPIKSLDSTKDGKWLLATCKTYLLLIPTFSQNLNGYKQQLGSSKPIPKKLHIHPQDMAQLKISTINFSPARFDDSLNNQEKYIVSGSGNFVITWSMKNILQGKIFDYCIKKVKAEVINSEFRFEQEDSLYITMPQELCVQKASKK